MTTLARVAPHPAFAQTPPAARAAAQDEGEPLTEAKELFRRGVLLFEAGDTESALDAFRRSRARFPSMQNTMNVGICLEALERFDEALDAYEDVIASFHAELSEKEREHLTRKVQALRARIGTLDVSSNVNGVIVVDGRERAKLPLAGPIRVTAGTHRVRVIKDGYVTFEATVGVRVGVKSSLDARLQPLAAAGGLRVEDAALVGGEVFVDGVAVGTLPWEGTLAPGPHVVASRRGGMGSAPTQAVVLQGQTALVRLRAGALGPVARIVVKPASAEIVLGDVVVGKGQWEGALPVGRYEVVAREAGYFRKRATFEESVSASAPRMELALDVDADDPRWPRATAGAFSFGVFGGYGFSGSMRSGAENNCATSCARHGVAGGFLAGARGAYELRSGLAIEGAAGYLSFGSRVSRSIAANGVTAYALDDDVRVQGFWLAGGASFRAPLAETLALRPRLSAGFLVAHSSDSVTGASIVPGGASSSASIANAGDVTHTTPFFATAELWLERSWSSWRVAAGVAAFWLPNAAPSSTLGDVSAPGVAASRAIASERTYGPLLVVLPQIAVSYGN